MSLVLMGEGPIAPWARRNKKLKQALRRVLRAAGRYHSEQLSNGPTINVQLAYVEYCFAVDHANKILKET